MVSQMWVELELEVQLVFNNVRESCKKKKSFLLNVTVISAGEVQSTLSPFAGKYYLNIHFTITHMTSLFYFVVKAFFLQDHKYSQIYSYNC